MRTDTIKELAQMVHKLSQLTAEHAKLKPYYDQIQPDPVTIGMLLNAQDKLIADIVAAICGGTAALIRDSADAKLLDSLDFEPGDEAGDR